MKLSNIILASTVALSAVSASFAGEMHFGGRLNLGYASFWNTDISFSDVDEEGSYKYEEKVEITGLDDASGVAFGFGLAMNYKINSAMAFQPELMIAYRNRSTSSLVANETEIEYRRDREYNYWTDSYENGPWELDYVDRDVDPLGLEVSLAEWFIDVPLLFRYSMSNGVFFNAGPVVSINLSAEGEASGLSLDVGDFTTTFVFGAEVGVGYSLPLNGRQLDIDLRLHMGITALVSDDISYMGRYFGDGTEYGNPKDLNIMVGVTYWFM